MIRHRLIQPAEAETYDAAQHYESAEPGLGSEFLDELDDVLQRLRSFPEIGTPISSRLRASRMSRFPYSVIYYVEADSVVVVSVSYQSRHPEHWRSRLS